MDKKILLLDEKTNPLIVRIIQVVFGILCIGIAIFWIIFNLRSVKSESGLWITVVFLTGFGLYQILAGAGKTIKYIEVNPESIILKQNSFLPKIELKVGDIERIEIFPLSITFRLVNRNNIILRFGLNYTEIIDPAKNAVTGFAEAGKIPVEMMVEEL